MRRLTFLLLCLFIGIGVATAQTMKITGNVISSEDQQPVIGAAVVVKGTTIGTVTDFEGNFSLDVPRDAKMIFISYVGLKTKEVPVASVINVVLDSDSKALDEVVVTAMGLTREKKALGYALQEVKSDELTKAGRPVLVGTTSVEISELLSRMLTMRKIQHNVLNAKLHQKEAEIVALAGQKSTVTIATNMAGRGTDIKLSKDVKDAGGLAIIGTERHESRRVDRQLRGRAGRQGDPGSSVFFVSLEDDLMRLFASEKIAGLMDKLGFKEGEVLEHNMLSKSVERAQKKVEENNFGIRKRLLEYDDVMNSQRNVIYTRRRHALMGERIGLDVLNTIYDTSTAIADQHAEDFEGFKLELFKTFAMESPFTEDEFKSMKPEQLVEKLFEEALKTYKRRMERMTQVAHPVIKQVYENQGAMYENIMIPITDGKRMYNVSCNLKEAYDTECKAIVKSFQKSIVLHMIDEGWKEHLREMDELRHSVQNASYENKDPLLIYKLESYNLFKTMVDNMNRKTAAILMRGQIPVREEPTEEQRQAMQARQAAVAQQAAQAIAEERARQRIAVQEAAPEKHEDMSRYRTEKTDLSGNNTQAEAPQPKQAPVRAEKRVGRNDPCPCGSGKKYKNCHGQGL